MIGAYYALEGTGEKPVSSRDYGDFGDWDGEQEMAKVLRHPRVYSFLHVPVQAGSDNVLLDMKREYTVEDFERVVDFLKER